MLTCLIFFTENSFPPRYEGRPVFNATVIVGGQSSPKLEKNSKKVKRNFP